MTTENLSQVFDTLANLLLPFGVINSPAQVHGAFTGRLVAGQSLSPVESAELINEMLDPNDPLTDDVILQLSTLYSFAEEQLKDTEFSFELLMPDDDSELFERLQSLSQWCHGFLHGFGTAEDVPQTFSDDTRELLEDIASIVNVALDDEEPDASEEANFMEVAEYVRLGVVALYLELNPTAEPAPNIDTPQGGHSLH